MKRKQIYKWVLMAAVVGGLSLAVTACKDDDAEDEPEVTVIEDDPYQKTGDLGSALFRLVNQLADVDSLSDNWQTATFEPTKGKVLDASQPYVRSIAVQNAGSACDVFRSLIGQDFDESKSTVEWKQDGVGSLTLNILDQADCVATIDVQLKQMPHLVQLRLLPPSAFGDNALKYNLYYRIGDVVMDKDSCYWICVRSAGGPDDKEKTHWVSMHMLTENSKVSGFKGNVKTITTRNHAIQVPQNLGGTEVKHLKYFAQLMYLLQRPNEYQPNTGQGGVLAGGLGDLGLDPKRYDGVITPDELKQIARLWDDLDIWSRVLPKGVQRDYFLSDDVRMLYNGHSNDTFGSGITLYVCSQTGTCRSEQHLTTPGWDKKDATKEFDVREYMSDGRPTRSNINGINNANGRAIVVRMCTGKELANNLMFQPDYYERIKNVDNLIVSRFRLNDYSPYYRVGDVFKDEEGHRWFVVSSAGYTHPDCSFINSPYSYLVSFEGIKASDDKRYATNLPKYNLAMKTTGFLAMMNSYVMAKRYANDRWSDHNYPLPSIKDILDYADVDIAFLFDWKSSPRGVRQGFVISSACYDGGSAIQRLFRLIIDTERQGNRFRYSFWTIYPQDQFTTFVEPQPEHFYNGIFTHGDIFLEDITYQDMIDKYAKDYYANQPYEQDEESDWPHASRTQPDARARYITNYYYDRQKMNKRQLPLSMWNDRVLVFRAAMVFDNGIEDYEKTTVDGHKLTPLHKEPYDANTNSDYYHAAQGMILGCEVFYDFDNTFENGTPRKMSSWLDDMK